MTTGLLYYHPGSDLAAEIRRAVARFRIRCGGEPNRVYVGDPARIAEAETVIAAAVGGPLRLQRGEFLLCCVHEDRTPVQGRLF